MCRMYAMLLPHGSAGQYPKTLHACAPVPSGSRSKGSIASNPVIRSESEC